MTINITINKFGEIILQLFLAILLYFESLPKNINELLIIFEDTFFEKGNNKKIISLNRKNSKKYLIETKKVIIDLFYFQLNLIRFLIKVFHRLIQ